MFRFSLLLKQSNAFTTSVQDRKKNTHIIYTVELLKKKIHSYLRERDTAQASEQSFQACKLAMIEYVKKLESTTLIEIVPANMDNPWSYRIFRKLNRLLMQRVDSILSEDLHQGWTHAYRFHIRGWNQNDLSVEDVQRSLPYVLRFLDVMDNQLKVDHEMALYLKSNLFNLNLEELAIQINKDSECGKLTLIIQNINMSKIRRVELNAIYSKKFGEELVDVLFKNKNGFRKHFHH